MHVIITKAGTVLPVWRHHTWSGVYLGGVVAHTLHEETCVRVETAPDLWRICLHHDDLPRRCFEALVTLLVREGPAHIVIEFNDLAAGATEVFYNLEDVVARLDGFRGATFGELPRPRLIFEELSLERLRSPARRNFSRIYQVWKRRRGLFSNEMCASVARQPVGGVDMVVRIVNKAIPITEKVPDLKFWSEDILLNMVGQPMDQHPDPTYSLAAAEGLLRTHRAQRPHLELVDATVAGVGTRARYERLLLPWFGEDGSRFVSSSASIRWRRPALAA